MLIRVTRAHIESGERCSSEWCMVALAIAEAVPGLWSVRVSDSASWIQREPGGRIERIPLADSVRGQIRAFDDYRPVQPFEFELPDDFRPLPLVIDPTT